MVDEKERSLKGIMNMRKSLIQKYNASDTLIVISSYPAKGAEPAKINAVACYAKNLLHEWDGRRIVVLAEKSGNRKYYTDGNVLVIHCWQPGDLKAYWDIIKIIKNFDKAKDVLVQFEFNVFASTILTNAFPYFLGLLKIIGKRNTVMLHQVVSDLSDLGGHLNIKRGSIKGRLLNMGLHHFYRMLGIHSNSIIVHEDILKKRLSKWVKEEKIEIISHGLSLSSRNNNKAKLREEMGIGKDDLVLLMFGYITWYKGTDWMIDKLSEVQKAVGDRKVHLIVAGGKSATLSEKKHYTRFVQKVDRLAKKNSDSVTMTGFVPENKVRDYFSVSDLMVLPYRAMMSASGPLSFALRFSVPFVISSTLNEAYNNPDFLTVLQRNDVKKSDFSFSMRNGDFGKLIAKYSADEEFRLSLKRVSEDLRQERKWRRIVDKYSFVIEKENLSFTGRFVTSLKARIPNFNSA